ncbi:MAG: acyltransferase [Acetobacteraceae bacterium]|nr:acyltransferase [Acetobacteraceae bacterium]
MLSRSFLTFESKFRSDISILPAAAHNYYVIASNSSHSRRLEDLTCLRALLAFWVFSYHLCLQTGARPDHWVGAICHRGYLGVDGFFVLSGFVLAHGGGAPLSPSGCLRFWGRRLLRIYPLHAATILLLLVLLAAATVAGASPRDPERFALRALWQHLVLIHGWGWADGWAWNYPSWSISSEWAGYLAFPLLAAGMMRLPAVAAGLAVAAGAVALAWLDRSSGSGLNVTLQGPLWRFLPEFTAGIALCRTVRVAAPAHHAGMLASALAALGLAVGWLPDTCVVAALAILIGSLAAIRHGRGRVLDRLPGLHFLGGLSYAFYMSFALAEMLLSYALRVAGLRPPDQPLLYMAAMTSLTLLLAAALSFGVERSALRLLGPTPAS